MTEKTFKLPKNRILNPETDYFTGAKIDWQMHGRIQAIEAVKQKGAVIDIGAHVGITVTHWLLNHFLFVHAFEIHPDHFSCLLENTKEYREKIKYYNVGLSNEKKSCIGVYRKHSNSGTFQILDEINHDRFTVAEKFPVEVDRLDNYVFDSISLIKIDVEGWEYEVIDGAKETIKAHKPIMFVEYGQGNNKKTFHKYDNEKFLALINNIGYSIQPCERDYLFIPN